MLVCAVIGDHIGGLMYALYFMIAAYIIIGVLKIFLNWSIYINGIRHIESRIFGRPLDKDYWPQDSRGRAKIPKIKFKFRRCKNGKSKKDN